MRETTTVSMLWKGRWPHGPAAHWCLRSAHSRAASLSVLQARLCFPTCDLSWGWGGFRRRLSTAENQEHGYGRLPTCPCVSLGWVLIFFAEQEHVGSRKDECSVSFQDSHSSLSHASFWRHGSLQDKYSIYNINLIILISYSVFLYKLTFDRLDNSIWRFLQWKNSPEQTTIFPKLTSDIIMWYTCRLLWYFGKWD